MRNFLDDNMVKDFMTGGSKKKKSSSKYIEFKGAGAIA